MSTTPAFASTSLTDPALYDDPWEFYAWLRREHPLWFDANTGLYAVSRHADVLAISRDAERFSSAEGVRPVNLLPLSIATMDDPEHARQRRVISRQFTPRQVTLLTEGVCDVTNSVIDNLAESGQIEVVTDLARHVPLIVITELLGLDRDLSEQLYAWSEAMMAGEGQTDPQSPLFGPASEAFGNYVELIGRAIEDRRQSPKQDLISVLTSAYDDGKLAYAGDQAKPRIGELTETENLSDEELLMFCVLLLVAGNETTRNAIAGGLRAFSLFPEQKRLLAAKPELIDSAVEEIVRWTSPVLNFVRTVTSPVTVAGQALKPGDRLLLLYQSANRDETVFDQPDELRIDRDPNPHLAFGIGPHYCLGANLARMEIKVVFQELFRRLPDIAVADATAQPERNPSTFVAGIRRLPARFTPVSR